MRIWFQKHVSLGKVPALDQGYEKHAREVARPDTRIDFYGTPKETYEGNFPARYVEFAFAEMMFSSYFLSRALEAEQSGYDAFIIGTAPDCAIREAKSVVDIPVIGYSEASMHVATMLGSHFSYIGFVNMADRHVDNARIYGLGDRIGPWARVSATSEIVQDAIEGRPGAYMDAFYESARKVIDQGINVLIPNEGLTNEILYHQGISQVDGVPIVDSHGVTFKMAEMMVDLSRTSGMKVSRKGYYYARPPAEMVKRAHSLFGSK